MQVSRCLTLLSQDEGAATAFYSRLYEHAGVPSAAKVFAMLLRCAVVAARTPDNGGDGGGGRGGGEEDGGARQGKGRVGGEKKGKRKGVDKEGGRSSGGGDGGGERTLRASDSKVGWGGGG